MIDLTKYSDEELSMQVFNNYDLYKIRFRPELKDILSSMFIFTIEQWNILSLDIDLEAE